MLVLRLDGDTLDSSFLEAFDGRLPTVSLLVEVIAAAFSFAKA